MNEQGYFYLASPYSHPSDLLRHIRVERTRKAIKWLLEGGLVVYSPILHWHNTCLELKLPSDAKSWKEQNRVMQGAAGRGLIVLELEGWKESLGVNMEIDWALEWKQPIHELIGTDYSNEWFFVEIDGDPRK